MVLEEKDIIQALVAAHWLGIALGLGGVAVANAYGLRTLLLHVQQPQPHRIHAIHRVVMTALLLLMSSGAGLLVLRTSKACDAATTIALPLLELCLPAKLGIKLPLVGALMLVAFLVDRHLTELLERRQSPLLAHLALAELPRIAAIEAGSLICWISLTTVALVAEVQRQPPLLALAVAALAWLTLAGLILSALVMLRTLLIWRLRRAPHDGRRADHPHAGAHARRAPPAGPVLQFQPSAADGVATGLRRPRHGPAPIDEEAVADAERPSGLTLEQALAACRPVVAGLLAVSLVINLLMLTGPLYMLQVYDRVLTSRSRETLALLTILLVGLFAVLGALELIRSRVLSRLSLRLDRLIGPDLIARAIAPAATATRGAGPALLRDLEQVRNFVSGPLPPALLDLPWAPFYILLVFLLHPLLGLVTLVGAGILTALSLASQLVTRRRLATAAEESNRCHGLVEAGRASAEALQAMGMAGAHRARWLTAHRAALAAQAAAGDTASAFAAAIRVGRILLQSLILATGAWLALNDMVSAGAMIAASVITARALAPIEQLIAQWRSLVSARAALARLQAELVAPGPLRQGLPLPEPSGALAVGHLFVTPPGRAEPVLKGLNFRLQPGDALAVIGPSASGKSTLARALVGVWPARHGEVRLDGATLAQWDPEALGRHIGYLPQDVSLIDGTIAENIARLAPAPDPAMVIAAATTAGVHDMILRLEKGYASPVGANGVSLSGGQRQRIALARALYGGPALVVMDEPNANLDSDGEAALVSAITALRRAGRTVVVMAHRRAVLTACNRVLLLKEGRQAAFGTPQEVLGPPQQPPSRRPTTEHRHAVHTATRPVAAGH